MALLNAGRIELLLVSRRQGTATGLELGIDRLAELREKWLDHGARILCGQAGRHAEVAAKMEMHRGIMCFTINTLKQCALSKQEPWDTRSPSI